jgi:hypothetical protein
LDIFMASLPQARDDGECSVRRVRAADSCRTFVEELTHRVDGLSQVAAVFGSVGLLPVPMGEEPAIFFAVSNTATRTPARRKT